MRAGERQKIDNCSLVVTPIIGSGGEKMFEDANGYKTTQLFSGGEIKQARPTTRWKPIDGPQNHLLGCGPDVLARDTILS